MQSIGTLHDGAKARKFGDHLTGLEIQHDLDARPGGAVEIWVIEDHLDECEAMLARFQANPDAGEFQDAGSRAKRARAEAKRRAKESRRKQVDVRTTWGRIPDFKLGPVTSVLLGICTVVAIASQFGDNWSVLTHLTITEMILAESDGRVFPIAQARGLHSVMTGEVWRLLTPAFIHFGFIHFGFNMYWLFLLGRVIETKHRWWYMLALAVVIGVLSNLGQYYLPLLIDKPMLGAFGGMSGVVYGLLGFTWMRSRHDPNAGYVLNPQVVALMWIWYMVCLFGVVGNIANWAHSVGFLLGMVWGYASAPNFLHRLKHGNF